MNFFHPNASGEIQDTLLFLLRKEKVAVQSKRKQAEVSQRDTSIPTRQMDNGETMPRGRFELPTSGL